MINLISITRPQIFIITLLVGITTMLTPILGAYATPRIKDIVSFEGIRENILVGYGLVVGLNGTGDNLNNTVFTEKGLQDFLTKLGINTKGTQLKTKNVAAVTITATLPPFSRHGSRVDISVSTLGDAKSIEGGTLLATPLVGADGEVYAVAQGSVSIGGFLASAGNETVSKGVATNGFISNGAIVEREISFDINSLQQINLALHNPDIITAKRISTAINEALNLDASVAKDPGTVALNVPVTYENNVLELLADVEHLRIKPDQPARVVINEASGTIVMGENVKISTVAVAQGNLTVRVVETPSVSQPLPFAPDGLETVEVTDTAIILEEDENNKLAIIHGAASLRELVDGLNALGVGPRDMINILQTIKSAGALQAEIKAI